MSLARLFALPYLRIPVLAAAVVATVATSAPMWSLDDVTPTQREEVAPGEAVELPITFQGSHDVQLATVLDRFSPGRGQVRVQHDDARSGCSLDVTFTGEDGRWRANGSSWASPGQARTSSSCWGAATRGTATIRVTNTGDDPIAFDWHFEATISGEGDETPDGAFVTIQVAR